MQHIPLPMFRLGRYDYETAVCYFEHGRLTARIQPIIGLDTVLINQPKITTLFHLPGGRTPMAGLTAPTNTQALSRRDLIDGARKAMRAIYRRAREFPQSVTDPLVHLPPYHLLVITLAQYDTTKQWLHLHLEALPTNLQASPYRRPDF